MIANALSAARMYPAIHRAQWLSREELDDLQWNRFKKILEHAAEHSPFYKRRFAEIGLTPQDIRCRDDLKLIPMTTREDLRRPEELICTGCDPARMHSTLTSGSTGRRTTTYFDDLGWMIGKYLLKLRARWSCGVRLTDRIALFQEAVSYSKNTFFRRNLLRQRAFSMDVPIEESLAQIYDYGATAVYGFSSHLARLSSVNGGVKGVRTVFTQGEMLDGSRRRQIEKGFSAPLFDTYGTTEFKEIAWQCEARQGYHINSDWVLVEMVGHDGAKVDTGTTIISSLFNYGMPILRYCVGDTGRMLEGACPCGRGLPLMEPGLGRLVDYLTLPDGSQVSPYAITGAFLEKVSVLKQFQVEQVAADRAVVRVVTEQADESNPEMEIKEALREVLPGVQIEVDRLDRIEPEPSGKYRVVFSRIGKG